MRKPLFQRVRGARASEEVLRQLQDAIFSGQLGPGDRLPPARELADQFGVSRVSVRDALRRLESSGLVEIKVGSNAGTFVREAGVDPLRGRVRSMVRSKKTNVLELLEARKIVETAIVELAAERATEQDLKAMRAAIDAARRSSEASDFHCGPHSVAFHTALARAAKNRVLNLAVRSFRAFFSEILAKMLPTSGMTERAIAHHTALYHAIESHDSARARQLTSEHLAYVERKIAAFGDSAFADGGRMH